MYRWLFSGKIVKVENIKFIRGHAEGRGLKRKRAPERWLLVRRKRGGDDPAVYCTGSKKQQHPNR